MVTDDLLNEPNQNTENEISNLSKLLTEECKTSGLGEIIDMDITEAKKFRDKLSKAKRDLQAEVSELL